MASAVGSVLLGVVFFVGLGVVAWGLALIYWPAALIFVGGCLAVFAATAAAGSADGP